MNKEEFDNLTNKEKVDLLNRYVGKTNEFKENNEFSWSYATTHTSFVKKDGAYVEDNVSMKHLKDENKEKIIYSFRKEDKKKTSFQMVESFCNKLDKEKEKTGITKSELINYLLYQYFKEDCEADQDE